ncbi:MAG TPA: ABC transporter permease [bacterium]|nr:ABC transporter permease [bacterium]
MRFLLNPSNYTLSDPSSVPNLLVQHLAIVGTAMGIAVLVALPLGAFVARRRRLYLPVVGVAGFLYTIPGLALLAVLVPITGLGTTTIVVPLVLYAQLVLIRNTAAAIQAIDPLVLDVGRAVGMTKGQLLRRVVAPLALPLVIAGIRVATVTTIGIASLASLVGAGGLGDLIFSSIENANYDEVFAGGLVVAALAVVADLLLLAVETAAGRWRAAAVSR